MKPSKKLLLTKLLLLAPLSASAGPFGNTFGISEMIEGMDNLLDNGKWEYNGMPKPKEETEIMTTEYTVCAVGGEPCFIVVDQSVTRVRRETNW